ncbi:MAG: HlyD family secretion protein, partial [Terriglobia bacterium]
AQVVAARAEVSEAEAELHQAELQESYTKITAPEAGRVTNKSVEPGDYVQVGQPLFAIVSPQVWVTANFKETQLTDMRPGQPAEVEVDAYPSRALRGHVDSIQAGSGARFSLLPPENATGNFVKVVQRVPVKIVFDEQPGVPRVLGPGMSAVPEVKVKGSFGPAVIVTIVAGLVILLVLGATLWWLGRIRTR